ncbi:MAG: 5,10-methylene tetrahydromethanopterin reductase, partial [Chloroflexi bacterium]|nr:5,10-methylene tetrahydromethanopterin reductase [Chloroflexota bacterium]
ALRRELAAGRPSHVPDAPTHASLRAAAAAEAAPAPALSSGD